MIGFRAQRPPVFRDFWCPAFAVPLGGQVKIQSLKVSAGEVNIMLILTDVS